MNYEIHLRIYAEDHIRARLLEAENYQMLNQLRNQYPSGSSQVWQEMINKLDCSRIALGKKLEAIEAFFATWFEYERKFG